MPDLSATCGPGPSPRVALQWSGEGTRGFGVGGLLVGPDGSAFVVANAAPVDVPLASSDASAGPVLVKVDAAGHAVWAASVQNLEIGTFATDEAGDAYVFDVKNRITKLSGATGASVWRTAASSGRCGQLSARAGRVAVACQVEGGTVSFDHASTSVKPVPGFDGGGVLVATLDAATGEVQWANAVGADNALTYGYGVVMTRNGDVIVGGAVDPATSTRRPPSISDRQGMKGFPLMVPENRGFLLRLRIAAHDVAWGKTDAFVGAMRYDEGGGLVTFSGNTLRSIDARTGNERFAIRDLEAWEVAIDGSGRVFVSGYETTSQPALAVRGFDPCGTQLWRRPMHTSRSLAPMRGGIAVHPDASLSWRAS